MAFPNRLLTHSTWGLLGLGLIATVFALRGLSIVAPPVAAASLGVTPTTPEGRAITQKSMVFLGIRDVIAASALLQFHREGKEK